ncbi:hypothetical protein [Buttiauxella sp.]|uniref:hypothetical protein n=1 Tax=Buttiauxella sp. TaxID=1972222 RepID=UPI003C71CAAC
MANQSASSDTFLRLIGGGVLGTVIAIAVNVGGYKQQIADIGDDVDLLVQETAAIKKELAEQSKEGALQEQFGEELDRRLAKLEAR